MSTSRRKYYSSKHCEACDTQLEHDEIYHTNGVCPYCGVVSNYGILVDTITKSNVVIPTPLMVRVAKILESLPVVLVAWLIGYLMGVASS